MRNMRKKLTENEFNAIQQLMSSSHLDESFDVWQRRNGDDCFKDFDDGRLKSLHWGLNLLYESIAYPLSHEGLVEDESKCLVELFREFKIGNEEWYKWLLSDEE